MFSTQWINNCPTVDATPSAILMVPRPESSKIFKLLTHHQSTAACTPHRMPPSLTGPCVCHFAVFPQGLRLEVASCKCQAHNSHGTKNNENDVLHGVISFLKSSICHWNSLLLCVDRFGYQHRTALSFPAFFTEHPLLYVRPAIEELDPAFLTGVQKSNYLDIHERHSVEVQRNPRSSAF